MCMTFAAAGEFMGDAGGKCNWRIGCLITKCCCNNRSSYGVWLGTVLAGLLCGFTVMW